MAVDDAIERVFELSAASTTMSVQNGSVLLRRYFSASLLFGATGVFFTIEGFSEELAAHIVAIMTYIGDMYYIALNIVYFVKVCLYSMM